MRQNVDAHVLQRGAEGNRLVSTKQRFLDAQCLGGGGVGEVVTRKQAAKELLVANKAYTEVR